MIGLMALNGERFETMADVFREGYDKHPTYWPMMNSVALMLTRSGEAGVIACADVVHHLASSAHPDSAAQLLKSLTFSGDLSKLQIRLDFDLVDQSIRCALKTWPNSLEIRSDLALVALMLGREETARRAMRGMAGRWDRDTWHGREDIARRLTTPEVSRPASKITSS